MLNDVGLLKSFAYWLCEQDLVTFLYNSKVFHACASCHMNCA